MQFRICIYIMKQRPESVSQRFRVMNPNDLGVSVVTVAELEYGAAKSQNSQLNRGRLDNFLRPFQVVGLNEEDVRVF
ncbi:hypothetical protein AY599_20435 [Leptolyngbya valderiana BDU 20041]|nr:hypothetical protein AY599_20435 [Leptolyngbya valderiana BDU 20041]